LNSPCVAFIFGQAAYVRLNTRYVMDDVICNANSVMWIHDGLPRIVDCMHNGNLGW
jgi:hypothetical protein